MIISKSICNDKYYKKYTYLFNYSYDKFNLINKNILYNFMLQNEFGGNKICNIDMKYSFNESFYNNIIQKREHLKLPGFDFKYFIILKYLKKNTSYLAITNNKSIVLNNYNNIHNKYNQIDTILYCDINYSDENIFNVKNYFNTIKSGLYFSSLFKSVYLQFLKNLKNNIEKKNISIPKYKYDLISCHYGYIYTLSLTASYKMTLEIPNIISTIAMALKNIAKDGTLLLFWTILNVNIPVIKKILAILVYGFKTVSIIDNDINQNLLIGVPEYYIKCEGYKDNISNEIINKLLSISIEILEYTYYKCNIIDYYEDYTENNPNHSLFYNKTEEQKYRTKTKKYSSFSKLSFSKSSSFKFSSKSSKTRNSSSKSSKTRKSSSKSSTKSSTKSSSKSSKPITPIYYIEDINIPELDKIMENSKLQFEVSLLMNKLESIFVGYFKMVNNLIVNSIAKDKKGNMYVKKEAILQKDITNLTKLINMFEYNKLPYNKHALNVLLNKQDDILEHFYSLDTPVNQKLIKYEDKTSKALLKNSFKYFKSYNSYKSIQEKYSKANNPYNFDMINEYYNRIKIALQVKNTLISDVSEYENKTPKSVDYILHDFAGGLCQYLNNKYKTLPIQINDSFAKLWEILSIFNLIPTTTKSFKILHLCEAPGQMILCAKYWAETKCHNIDMENYEWMANSLNPYESNNKYRFDKDVKDIYGLIKNNYDKWLFGDDNTGDITKPLVIKSIMKNIKQNWLKNNKLDLIISDGSISFTDNDKLMIQKLDFSQVVSVLACSSIGGNCCIKHFIPYVNLNEPDIINNIINDSEYNKYEKETEGSALFISYLYLYYISFNSVSFYKPNSSKSDSSEFYVICKGFRGIEESYLDSLFNVLDNFDLNDTLIDKDKIPNTFLMQIKNFLESMSNTNILTIEKENLLLTCYKNIEENNKKVNSVLKCNNFFDKKKVDGIIIPKYKEWIKIYDFE